jgi:hypothetical protein
VGTSLPVSDTFLMRIYGLAKEVDYIEITDAPNGTILTNVDLGVGEQIMVYASGYNDTTGYYGLVKVDWTFITGGTLGSMDNISGKSTTFTAGLTDGLVEIDGTNYDDPTKTDSFTVTILPPTADYVLIRDAPSDTGLDLTDSANYPSYTVGYSTKLYGAGYNTTSGYIGIVSETSTWVSDDITIVTTTSPGNQTIINCSVTNYGTTTLTLTDGVLMATTNITVLSPNVDYIETHDAPGGSGNEVDTMVFNVQDNYTFYAAGFNNTVGYFGDVDVDWTISPTSGVGTVDAGPSESTNFAAVGVGTCIVTATYSPTVSSSTGLLTVEDTGPVVSYILIRDASGGAGNVVTTRTFGVNDVDMFYAAAYDSGDNYISDVEVNWSTSSSNVGAIDITTGIQTNFTAQQVIVSSTCTITATYDISISASTGDLTVLPPTVDEIRIVDTSSVGTTEIADQTVIVDFTVTGYAAAFNDSIGYLSDVDAIWSVVNTVGATATTFPTTGFSSEFDAELTGGTATWTADYTGIIGTVVFTITPPTVDSIIIRDAPNDGGIEVETANYLGGNTDTFYAAAYNDTADYLYDVEVTWSSDETSVGTVTTPGTSTMFTAQNLTADGICTVTATYSVSITDTTGLLTVKAATVDYIQIEDASGGNANEVTTATFDLDATVTDTYYCAGYNGTGFYVMHVAAAWSVATIGNVNPASGTSTLFTATTVGADNLTAIYSGMTASVAITVTVAVDTTPPAAPTSLSVSLGTEVDSLVITWNANTEADLAGYNLYRATSATDPFTKLNGLLTDIIYTDSGLSEGTYYYRLTAQDAVPNVSGNSTTVSGTITAPSDDRDNDGLLDNWEQEHFGDLDEDPGDDFDGDGFNNLEEYQADSDPTDSLITPNDSDGDGFPDTWELLHFGNLNQGLYNDYDNDGYNNIEEYLADTDPADEEDYPGKIEPEKEDKGSQSFLWWIIIIIVLVTIIVIVAILLYKRKP